MNNRKGHGLMAFIGTALFLVSVFSLPAAPMTAAVLVNGSFEEEGETPKRAKGWADWGSGIRRVAGAKPCRHGNSVMEYQGGRIKNKGSSGIW